MEAANVETDLESVSFTDKESDKISDTVRLDDDVEVSKTDVEESFELVNNGDTGDTDKCDDKNVTDDLVSTSKDIISFDSTVTLDIPDKIVDNIDSNPVSNIEETETGQTVDNDPEQLLTEVSADDENLLDEIHSGSFNTTSSPLGKSSSQLNASVQSIEDSYEMLENEVMEEEHDEEEDIEEEEEKDRTNDEHNDGDTIVLDDDDDDEDDEHDDRDLDDDSEDEEDRSENSDNDDDDSLDGTDKEDNHDYDRKDDDISTLSSDGDDGEMISKVSQQPQQRKPKITARKKVKTAYRRLVKKSIRILISPKHKRTMHLKSSSAITTVVTEHPNGNLDKISTEKAKETEKMVQMFSNESVEDDDDVCLIEDSPVKVNGKHETDDIKSVEQKIKIEQMELDENIESEIIDKKDDVEAKKVDDNVEVNGIKDESSSNKSQPPTATESIVTEPVPITTDSSSKDETVPTVPIEEDKPDESVSNPKPNHKRSRSVSPTDDIQPTKRLKTELEQTFIGHNRRVQDYIDKTSNNSVDEINNHVVSLLAEVQELHAMAAAKEQEWNNILYLKSVKEEIICRLTRRKSVMEITSSKVGEVEDYTILEQQPSISQKITKENRNSTSINHSANISHNQHAYLRNLSTTEAAKLINSRADMSTSDLDEERVTAAKMHSILFSRNILPKPELAGRSSPNINHLTSANMQQIQQQQQQKAQQQFIEQQHQIYQQTEHLNGHHQVGRQGAIKDVKSIIEAFRQKNPERAPRRGRRLKGNSDGTAMSPRSTDGILSRQSVEGRVSELGLLLAKDRNSRPSSADSSPGNSNLASTNNNITTANANIAFNDMLMQYAKLNERPAADLLTNAAMIRQQQQQQQQSGYPEVTLHPVSSQPNTTLHQSDSLQSNSLLHGILTKQNTRPSTTYNSFSPTLARLLTAPERITALPNNYRLPSSTPVQSKPTGINLTKPRNEITITPVMSNSAMHQTILQQQLQRQQDSAARMKFPLMDDEADDSADRLVIDEGDIHNDQSAPVGGREFPENDFPKCQGCKKHEAQFVCAGCENQWYCSRSCQVTAWDEHCEMCSG